MSNGAWSNDQLTELKIYDDDGNLIINLTGNPGTDGNFVAITDPTGNVVATINNAGLGSFQDLYVVDSPTIGGLDFQTQIIDPLPRGVIAYGQDTSTSPSTTGTVGLFEIAFSIDDNNRAFRINAGFWAFNSVAAADIGVQIRYTTAALGVTPGTPSTSSSLMYQAAHSVTTAGNGEFFFASGVFNLGQGNYRLLLCCSRLAGTGTTTISASPVQPSQMTAEDVGLQVPNLAVVNNGSGGGVTPVQQFTKTYNATWSGSYTGGGTKNTFGGSTRVYQGDIGDGNGNRKAMIGFDYATIASDLSGATILSCSTTVYFQHWWYNNGGTAVLGTHNYTGGSAPASWQGNTVVTSSSGWPNPGQRTVDLGTGTGTAFKNSTARGLTLGPGSDSSVTYYGYASGFGASSPPTLTITYTK